MSDGVVQISPDSTGKKIDTSEITVGANTVERQRIVLASPTSAANLCEVNPEGTLPASLVTRLPTTAKLTSAVINISASGDNAIVAGVALQTIRVFQYFFVVNTAVNIIVKDSTSTTLIPIVAYFSGASDTKPFFGDPWFTTAVGAGLVFNLSTGSQISGRIYYIQS